MGCANPYFWISDSLEVLIIEFELGCPQSWRRLKLCGVSVPIAGSLPQNVNISFVGAHASGPGPPGRAVQGVSVPIAGFALQNVKCNL
eukprot:75700-Chlamydomonas_euryale.AAC.2